MQLGQECRLCHEVQDALVAGRIHIELQSFAAWVFDNNPANMADDPAQLLQRWREEYTPIAQ